MNRVTPVDELSAVLLNKSASAVDEILSDSVACAAPPTSDSSGWASLLGECAKLSSAFSLGFLIPYVTFQNS